MEIPSETILRDRYIIKEQLGRGGMGAVYLAEDTALDQLVAVKANLNPGEQAKRQFETEARLLAKLRHPNLPLVFDHFIIDDVQYLVMDYIPGGNLNHRIREEGPQAVYKVLDWAEQISDALDYLHSQDPPVIHRDIKPANIKITPEGQIVLVDFGIAKASKEDTTVGARGYSPGYAPPEQYGQSATGHYSDQYSFAATLFALLTGTPPPESVDLMLGQKTLPSTRSMSRNVPLHVDTAIQRAMSVEPAKRYSSIKEFMTALTDPAALAEETQRKPILEAETVVQQVEQATQVTPPQETLGPIPQKPNRMPLYIGLGAAGIILLGVAGFFGIRALNDTPVAAAATDTPTATLEAEQPTEMTELSEAETPTTPPEDTAIPEPSLTPTLTPPPTETPTSTPAATPLGSGRRIAFVSNRDGNRYEQIFLMDPDGSNVTQLTFDEVNKETPMWSPDGSKIVYVADGGPNQFGNDFDLDIWTMDADGQNQTNITLYPGNDYDPIWTPDGEKIVFVTTRYGGVRLLAMVNPDGSSIQRLSLEFEEYNPTFSPDGETLMVTGTFFYTLSIRPNGGLDDPQLYDVRWSEGDRVGRDAIEPAWSPDGEWIVYIRNQDGNRLIYILEAESRGATLRRLDVPGLSYDPGWSPDSNWIVFTNSQDGNREIYIMDKGGRFLTNLSNNGAVDKMPSWKPVP
ncbi:MAG: protein kinase [Anaerolineales bacterium]|jgi:serine/threonine protein kinase